MNEVPKRKLNPLALVLVLSSAFFLLFLLVSGVLFLTKGPSTISRKASGPSLFNKGAVAIIELNGVIMDSKRVLKKLERAELSADIKAIVLRLNSPGGAVAPSQEIYEAVKKIKKPLVVSMGSVAASGAYYVACASKKVYSNPGTITGSIGVIMEFANLEKLYEWAKVERYAIKTGKFKDLGASYRAMPAEERALLQGMVDDVLLQFKQAIVDGRKLPMTTVTALADGRIFSGAQAKASKLVDELGTLQDAIDDAAEQGGIQGKPEITYLETPRRSRLLELILDGGDDEESEASSRSMLSRLLGGLSRTTSQDVPGLLTGTLPAGVYWLWRGAY
ncbi:MAG: signal peptide peptidase SppA [Oligoflexia bacterium]|nr:signal peptide peptidase SppA [Oligoflexia bacterium]